MVSPLERVLDGARAMDALRRSGLLNPKVVGTALVAAREWGPTLAGGIAAGVARDPGRTAIVDDEGSATYAELDASSNGLAHVLRARGVTAGTSIGLLGRNSRWFVIAVAALDKLGASVVYMNTGFAGPQLADVCDREGCRFLLHDDEFSNLVSEHAPDIDRLVLDRPARRRKGIDDVPTLVERADTISPGHPRSVGRTVILTSGTTGVPKGATRQLGRRGLDLAAATGLIERVPFRVNDVHAIAAPLFHSLGNAALLASGQMSGTVILARRFDPEALLEQLVTERVRVLTVVPVMLERILALPAEVLAAHRPTQLEVVFCSGSALPGSLATRWMDQFGDNLYNMYGSTEVAGATVATPADMRAAPGTAGKPLPGVEVRLYDDADRVVTAPGVTGRIFVGSALRFDGYTGGQTKASIDGLLSSGDLGHWDDAGRLFVGGRDDDMIVSGGENLFPREVEDLLADLDGVAEVAVVGVDDDEFGKRLAAFVVRRPGSDIDADSVRAHVKANLANFKVPRDVTFLDELPRNQTGKILRRELR